ncbi:hypothetical protein C5167_029969 [Papaver somniferum]|uniref:uncharacterized protein LOC113330124 n=1 Tax=Papaver somniferum TaxID=3469 RepID=UPI000E6F7604|nr:uncharacterized protein LOC113330124 [Papaver somniferum]RZC86618.1 hypothetical protein C5167_029969 [Papaver somniferum]
MDQNHNNIYGHYFSKEVKGIIPKTLTWYRSNSRSSSSSSPSSPKSTIAGDKKTVHPAFAINNIKTLIPIILNIKQDEYSSWVFLFELHLQAHRLLFLINGDKPPADVDADTVLQLDALCRQWMFSTMAKDLMLTVLKSGKTAKELWNHLKKLFQDNKGNRAATLERKFVNLKFINCTSIDDYYDKLKSLSDRLLDLDFPMDDKRLVIQLVNGLPEE